MTVRVHQPEVGDTLPEKVGAGKRQWVQIVAPETQPRKGLEGKEWLMSETRDRWSQETQQEGRLGFLGEEPVGKVGSAGKHWQLVSGAASQSEPGSDLRSEGKGRRQTLGKTSCVVESREHGEPLRKGMELRWMFLRRKEEGRGS